MTESSRFTFWNFPLRRFFQLFLFILIFIPFFYFYRENNINIRFVDEEENIVVGNFLNKGFVLYKDLFVQHQPSAYLLSGFLQKMFRSHTIYEVVSLHRDFIVFWSFIWGILCFLYFGWSFFLAFLFIETTKIFIFGNLFIAESLVVYPILFFCGVVFYKKNLNNYLSFFLGLVFSFVLLTLLPVWPFLLVFLFLLFKGKEERKFVRPFLLGLSLLSVVLFYRIPFDYYFYNVFYINYSLYIPQTGQINVLKSFFPFFDIFFKPADHTHFLLILRLASLFFMSMILLLLYKKRLRLIFLSFFILGLVNLRYIRPGLDFYRGFHSLPWFSSLVFVSLIFLFYNYHTFSSKLKYLFFGSFFFVYFLSFFQSKEILFKNRDKDRDYYVNYSMPFDIGSAVSIMKKSDSTMFIAPDQFLIYWQADINPFSIFVFYYPWMDKLDFFRTRFNEYFSFKKPDFFFCSDPFLGVCGEVKDYIRLRKDKRYTDLYVAQDLVFSLSEKQKADLRFYNFEF